MRHAGVRRRENSHETPVRQPAAIRPVDDRSHRSRNSGHVKDIFRHCLSVRRHRHAPRSVHAPAGDSIVLLEDFPTTLDVNTLRVEGTGNAGFEIGSIDHEVVEPTVAESAASTGIRAQIRTLEDERATLDDAIEAAEVSKRFIANFANVKPQAMTEDLDRGRIGVTEWVGAWSAVGTEYARANGAIRSARLRQREIDETIAELEEQIARDPGKDEPKLVLRVNLAAAGEIDGKLEVTYRVPDASWMPLYDARLDLSRPDAPAAVTLVRRAEVRQTSGEDWSDVALTLSTARTLGGTAAPDISPLRVAFYEPPRPMRGRTGMDGAFMKAERMAEDAFETMPMAAAPAPMDVPAMDMPAVERETTLDLSGFNATFVIPGATSVPTGGAAKSLRLGTAALEADVLVKSVPELDDTAYLSAKVINKSGAPILPGRAALYRDGAYIGDGNLAYLADGDDTTLGFGADDAVVVSRVPVAREEGKSGILTKKSTDERDYRITVKNLHDRKMKITVLDRLPYSEHEDITVEMLPGSTRATETDVDKERGVLAYTAEFEPKSEKEYRLNYRVTWPADRSVTWDSVYR
ncbi:MAG: mucoidy inhibitor MuiA family protein [Hyphomicrobiales bacterium]